MSYKLRHRRSSAQPSKRSSKTSKPARHRFSTLELLENRTLLSTYQVTTTADSGPGSLRNAIMQANADTGLDIIDFALGGSGMQVINLTSALPALTNSVTIDASASMVGGVPQVELNGAGLNADGLDLMAANCSVIGLSIVGFNGNGIMEAGGQGLIKNDWIGVAPDGTANGNGGDGVMFNSDGNSLQASVISNNQGDGVAVSGNANQILNNMIGTDASGEIAMGNDGNGVDLLKATHTTVRGNVISSNDGNGVHLQSSSFDVIAGNMIGTDGAGTVAMGNGGNGVMVDIGATSETVGGSTAADRNIISGNEDNGVGVQSGAGAGNVLSGNYIGTDVSGFQAVGNFGDGITVFGNRVTITANVVSGNLGNGMSLYGNSSIVTGNIIGAGADRQSQLGNFTGGGFSDGLSVEGSNNVIGTPGDGNIIAYNSGSGIEVFMGAENSIRGNSMFDNANLGIDLGADGYTLNDSSGHGGADNNFQDYPLITLLTNLDGVLTGGGTIDEKPNVTYTIDLYSTDSATADNHGEGGTWLGSVTVVTDSSGHGTFSFTIADSSIPAGDTYLVGTATDSMGNTSEFSNTAAIPAATQTSANTSTTLTSSAGSSIFGQTITLTATVTPMSGTLAAMGTVDFYEEGGGVQTLLGSGTLSSGVATLDISSLGVGDHQIVASYEGDSGFNASQSAALDQQVSRDVTTTLLSSTTTVSNPGQAVSFTAIIMPAHSYSGAVTGTVSFFDVSPTGVQTLLGTINVSNSQAVLTTTTLSVGTHTVVAVYNGNAGLQSSTSNTVTETVKAPVQLGTISGHVYNDVTGNGLSSDDTGLGGVTVKLYKDTDNNGVLDSGDKVVATQISAADGSYSFANLAAGKYFVTEAKPSGFVRTAPATSTYYTESMNGQSISLVDFDNYETSSSRDDVTKIEYIINGHKHVKDLHGQCHQGDTITVNFTILANHSVTLSFVSYTAPDSHFKAGDASQDVVYNYETGMFTAGRHDTTFTMTIQVPKCDFHVDFVCGQVINQLGPAGSNIFYSQQDRLFSADSGGNEAPVGIVPIGQSVLT